MIRRLPFLLLLLFAAGCDMLSPTSPGDPGGGGGGGNLPDAVVYTALGASDTTGFGGSQPCIPFVVCDNGTGYVQVIARRLAESDRAVTTSNLGIPGAVLSPEIEAIGDAVGPDIFANILERELPFVRSNTTVVTIFAGGNDVNTIGKALVAGEGGSDPGGYIAVRVSNFGRDMRALVNGIREKAPAARIVILNLPNMAALPYASGQSLANKRWLQTIAVGFNAEINALTSLGALVVDLMCDPGFYQVGIFSGDGFHPNDAGYALMADAAYPAVSAGTMSPPRATCPQMAVF